MKKVIQLLLIIITGAIITFFISIKTTNNKITIVAIGDGFAKGLADINVQGKSFNDYLYEYFKNKGMLEKYNNDYCIYNLTVERINDYLDKNIILKDNISIKQLIASADILTIAIGQDEFYYYSSLETLDFDNNIETYIKEYEILLKTIRKFYDKKIIIVGMYPEFNMTKNITFEINKNLQKLASKYNAKYIDTISYSIKSDYYLNAYTYYLNYKAHKEIFKQIVKFL